MQYEKFVIETYSTEKLLDLMGPAQAQSGTLNVQVGAVVAYNNPTELIYFDINSECEIDQIETKNAKLV